MKRRCTRCSTSAWCHCREHRDRILPTFTPSCAAAASRGCCCGRSTRALIRMAGSTAFSASSTDGGSRPRSWCCARNTLPAINSSSTTPVRPYRSRIATPAQACGADLCRRARLFQLHHAEATASQGAGDWLGAHVRALEYFGGAPRAIVPDNLKSGVAKAHRYDPDINRAYQDFAEYYQLAVLPARVRKPRDKAKVESGVLVVERWILARLRNQDFFSFGELNNTIAELIERLNTRPFKKIEGNRRSRFEALERAALKPLPARPYEFGEWRKAKVHPDYHIEVARAYYSVPYRLIGERVDVRLTARAVEIFHAGQLVAAHPRAKERAQRLTRRVHRPEKHIAVIDQHLDRVLERAFVIGPATFGVVQAQAGGRKHPEETLRSAQGILRLAQDFSPVAARSACERALALKGLKLSGRAHADPDAARTAASPALDLAHENVRGAKYFQ